MPNLIRRLAIAVLLMTYKTYACAACAQVDGARIAGLNEAFGVVDARAIQSASVWRHVDTLRSVYSRISAVAGIRPALIVCSESELGMNAVAKGDSREGFIAIDSPMLALLDGSTDEIAAVMAHEYSHLLLDHTRQISNANSNLLSWARTIAAKRYEQTADSGDAIRLGGAFLAVESARFSRAIEQEADEKGFSLAVTLAHFNGDGFKTFALKLSKLPQTDRPPYLDDHPGWVERFDQADILTLNQHYLDSARTLFSHRDWKLLSRLVNGWLRQVPASGAAWYYKGRLLVRTSRNPSHITRAFEDSASLYVENAILGTKSQEDQVESDDVWLHLCLALFDEGYKFESANCSRRIGSDSVRERFRMKTFGGQLIVAGNEQPSGNLLVARESDGSKLFTNDRSIAASRGTYQPISPVWKAIRYPENLPR